MAIYFSVKNIEYSHEDQSLKGISVGLRDDEKETKETEDRIQKPEVKKKKVNKSVKRKQIKKLKKEKTNAKPPEEKINKDIALPTTKEKILKNPRISNIKKPKKFIEEAPITIKKIYQNDVFTDDVDSLNLSSVYTRSIKNHLNFCFSSLLEGQNNSLEMVEEIEIVFNIAKNGVIKFDFEKNVDNKLLKDEKLANYKEIIDKINKKTQNCAIFRNLPTDKYEIWKEFKVLFTSKK